MNEPQLIALFIEISALAERLGVMIAVQGGEFVLRQISNREEWRRCKTMNEVERAIDDYAAQTILLKHPDVRK